MFMPGVIMYMYMIKIKTLKKDKARQHKPNPKVVLFQLLPWVGFDHDLQRSRLSALPLRSLHVHARKCYLVNQLLHTCDFHMPTGRRHYSRPCLFFLIDVPFMTVASPFMYM